MEPGPTYPIQAHYRLFDTAIGPCGVAWSERGLTRLQLPEAGPSATEKRLRKHAASASRAAPAEIEQTIAKLQRYLTGGRLDFSPVAVDLTGIGPFQRRVYEAARAARCRCAAAAGIRLSKQMPCTILLTGFGPFPGAPINPTGPLVRALARRAGPGFRNARRVAHVFHTSYQAVDRELPALIARERPDALVMFGLAPRSPHLRVETLARNALSSAAVDASGHLPTASVIVPGAPEALPLHAPAHRLLAAARAAGMRGARSGDAG